ncbi:MAG: hypothetical protein HY662_03340 [Chloroflexi bacterium]|nr:hypothetical protein [Chloroflexota bacterium]
MLAQPVFVNTGWVALSIGGTVNKISLPFFYDLGTKLHDFAETNISSRPKWSIILSCQAATKQLKLLFQTFPDLGTSIKGGAELVTSLDEWLDSTNKPQSTDKWNEPPAPPESWHIFDIVRQAARYEPVLIADLENLATFLATQKGAYSTRLLIVAADTMFPDSTRKKLPEPVLAEIREAGRCFAFDNSTAAGYHMLRATELVIHQYYLEICKPDPIPSKRLPDWGKYIEALQTCVDDHAKKVAATLKHIKDQDRNPIMHPEILLDSDGAHVLIEMAKSSIMTMADKLPIIVSSAEVSPSLMPVP